MKEPYFFGDVDQEKSESILIEQKPSTFLIRFSSRDPGNFSNIQT